MKITKKISSLFVLFIALVGVANAQEKDEFGYNINSLRPIHEHDQLWRRSVWVRMDCKEKQNKPFFAKNNEITKVIIESVKAGILRPFLNDSLTTRMSFEDFVANLTEPGGEEGLSEEEKAMGFGADDGFGGGGDGWGDETGGATEGGGDETPAPAASNEYLPKFISILEIKIDLIFDKKRSRWYRDIQSITMILPAEKSAKQIDQPIASFSYKELVENVFKDNGNAIWYNDANNPKEHRNLSEAFDLTLYAAHMIRYSNPDDASIVDFYETDAAAIVASMQLEHQLVDFETEFWEY